MSEFPNLKDDPRPSRFQPPLSTLYGFLNEPPNIQASYSNTTPTQADGSTRGLSTYDKHLGKSLLLQRVRHCPRLADLLVDKLRDLLETLPTTSSGWLAFITEYVMKGSSTRLRTLSSEIDVHQHYLESIAIPVSWLANILITASEDTRNHNFEAAFTGDSGIRKAIANGVWWIQLKHGMEAKGEGEKTPVALVYKACTVATPKFFEDLQSFAKKNPPFAWKQCKNTNCGEQDATGSQLTTKNSNLEWVRLVTTHSEESSQSSDFVSDEDKKPMMVLQQIWAQACKHDVTLMMITTCVNSVIMLRDRETQSLYISDTMESSNSYLHLMEVTLAVVYQGFMDLKARNGGGLTDSTAVPNRPLPEPDDDPDHEDDDKDGEEEDGSPRKRHRRGTNKKQNRGIQKRGRRKSAPSDYGMDAAFLYFRYKIWQSPHPALLRKRQLETSLARSRTSSGECGDFSYLPRPSLDNHCPSILIHSPAGQGSGGDVWRAQLRFNDGIKFPVVVKIGKEYDLYREELAYERFRNHQVDGVPKYWGTFGEEDSDDHMLYIVLEDVGSPINVLHPREKHWMTPSERDQLVASLKSIHQAGVLHGDLRAPNLMEKRGEDGKRILTIIDFHHAEVEGKTRELKVRSAIKARNAEMTELELLLQTWFDESKYKDN